jgi:tetratricopeptide (TPR) repeat protein
VAHPIDAAAAPLQARPPSPPSSDARAALERGRARFQADEHAEALAEVRRAAELAPDWFDAHLQLGKLLLTLSAVKFGTATHLRTLRDEGIQALERAHALQPTSADAAYWAGQGHFVAQAYPEARARFARALELDADHALAQKELGLAFAADGETAAAKRELKRAAELLPRDDEVQFQLGLQLENEDDFAGALALHLRAIELNPIHPGPRTRLVALYERLGDPAAAGAASSALARCKALAERLATATQNAQQHPRDPDALVAVGAIYRDAGMLGPARPWASRALRLDPEHAGALELTKELQ